VFINLETDPCIPHSSPYRACVNLPLPIAFGLPLTSTLGCYSDSHSCPRSDTPRTPTHVRTRTLLGLPLTSVLGHYSDSCSLPRSDSTRNPALVVLSIRLSEYSSTSLQSHIHVYQPHSELRIYPHYEFSELHSDVLLRRPLGHLCLNSSYKSEPVPRTPFGPASLSALPSNSARRSARASARTSVSRSALRVRAHAFGARSDLHHCPRYKCHVDPNRL
jgi:hypothetical protein